MPPALDCRTIQEGYAWPEDKEHCEEFGRMLQADSSKVSERAKKRGLSQLGTVAAQLTSARRGKPLL